ncbi:MAG TPA: hypothetical protein VNI54_03120 [Thermoanaerobaculia bacterium]|nr:hypothetical protein [Thermoanaerobaculia bacterium]
MGTFTMSSATSSITTVSIGIAVSAPHYGESNAAVQQRHRCAAASDAIEASPE